jgi:uncharacterized protein
MRHLPMPPFTRVSASDKVRLIEDSWNSREPVRASSIYAIDGHLRDGAKFLSGRTAIKGFLTRKWARELDYRNIKELWAFAENRIAVQCAYEYRVQNEGSFRANGLEVWEFDGNGLMRRSIAATNHDPITTADQLFLWPLGRRPDDAPELSDFDL